MVPHYQQYLIRPFYYFKGTLVQENPNLWVLAHLESAFLDVMDAYFTDDKTGCMWNFCCSTWPYENNQIEVEPLNIWVVLLLLDKVEA